MTKRYLRKLPCEKCGSSDGKQEIEEDGHIHYHCFVCNTHTAGDMADSGSRQSPRQAGSRGTVSSPESLPFGPLKSRGIRQEIAEAYGVKIQYSETNGEEYAYWFPRTKAGAISGWQVRVLPKSFKSIGDTRGCELFGQSYCGSGGRLLLITEGNEDCLAAKQLLMERGKNYRVVSLPSGANAKSISNNLEWVESFESVILLFDQDDAGRACEQAVGDLLTPGKVRVARFSEKDCNDLLKAGKGDELLMAINNARVLKPEEIVGIEEIYEEAIKPVERGSDWPWPTLTEVTYGRRRREMYGFGAGTGAGKTEAFKEIMQHILTHDNLPIGVFSLEEHPALTAKIIAGKIANKKFHVPDAGWTVDELRDGVQALRDKVFLYNHFGQKDWDTIRSKIRYMVVSLGIKDIFLDHLTALVAETENVNKEFERVMADMAALSQELDFTLYFISHLTRPSNGPSHEEGGRVTVSQFRGSGAIGFWANFLFGLERNQQAESEGDRNTVRLRVLKDRYTGIGTGRVIDLNYDQRNGRFLEDIVREF